MIRGWAVLLLGRLFATDVRVRVGQRVIDTGPCRWVRDPSSRGLMLVLIGLGLALGNWAGLATAVILPIPAPAYRIRIEENAPLRELGEPYQRFLRSRSRLLPHVW